jgi:5'-3' exonuclease
MALNGYDNAVIYGFFQKLFKIADIIQPKSIVFTWDAGGSKRREVYPEYKMGRDDRYEIDATEKKLNELGFQQFWDLRDGILPKLGFKNIFYKKGFEADDFMAELAFRQHEGQYVVLATNDSDMYQCLSDNCCIYNLGKDIYYKKSDFVEEFGIQPRDWSIVKAIAGCGTDNVKGVEGVGEKRAIDYLTNKMKPTSVFRKRIKESEQIINRNHELVCLPYIDTPVYSVDPDETTIDSYLEFCQIYGMNKFMSKPYVNRWKERFCEQQ